VRRKSKTETLKRCPMTERCLDYFLRPLLDDLAAGYYLLVIGAGLSRNAILPAGLTIPLLSELGDLVLRNLNGFTYSGRSRKAYCFGISGRIKEKGRVGP
jgi:hypothetical protein